ncbi:MAG: hypothetical protein KDC80_13515 [Saprospiraceae bacterium]|nr:hypothetical protein [Saprospiraceae bacterium]
MKLVIRFAALFLIASFFTSFTATASDIIGTWVYEVADAPPEHAKGEITISMEGEQYKAEIKTPGGMITLNDLKVDGNKINFSVMVEGSDVEVELVFDGDKMAGKAESYDGVFMMKGERKK